MTHPPWQNPLSSTFQSMAESQLVDPRQAEVPQPLASGAPLPTQYEFIMQTGDENTATTKKKLKTVRSHVMKNYLQQQHQQQQGRQSYGSASSSFAASTDRRREKQRARSSRSESRDTEGSTSPRISERLQARPTSASTEFEQTDDGVFPPTHFSESGCVAQPELGQGQHFALDFNFAPSDEVSTYAQVYVNHVAQDRKSGLLQPSLETLNAKGEAIRRVQDTIAVCGNRVPQTIILAMALLAHGCGADQAWDEARGHVEALKHVLDMRGGMHTLDFELQRTVSWTAYSLAATLRLPSQFPPSIFPDSRPCPLAFHDDAQIRAWRTVKRFPKDTSFVFDLVLRFHQLGLASSSEWCNEVDQRALSNLYFETMHSAVVVTLNAPWNGTLANGIQGREAAIMFKVWTAGLPLFIWATARHAKAQRGIIVPRTRYDPIFARIRALLEDTGGYHTWPRGKTLEPMLATLFYAVEACEYGDIWRPWCVDALRRIAELSKIKAVEEFRKALEFFPSTDAFRATVDNVWNEMMHTLPFSGMQ